MTGIFCVEGRWNDAIDDRSSVHKTLLTLSEWFQRDYVYERALVPEQLAYLIREWRTYAQDFKILYLACHGETECISLRRDGDIITLDDIAEMIGGEEWGGVIYLGSCKTMAAHGNRLRTFLKKTGMTAIVGYKENVEYMDGLLLDTSILYHLSSYQRFTSVTLKSVENRVRRQLGGIADEYRLTFARW